MNNGFTAERYAEIVNVYGSAAAGDRARRRRSWRAGRSGRTTWSGARRSSISAGKNFDILGVHNYEYEPESFETGLRRIRDYLAKLRDYIRASAQPQIRDRRAGVESLADLRLAGRAARGRQSHAVRGAGPGTGDDVPGPADAQHDGRSDVDVVDLPRSRVVVSRRGVSRSKTVSRALCGAVSGVGERDGAGRRGSQDVSSRRSRR